MIISRCNLVANLFYFFNFFLKWYKCNKKSTKSIATWKIWAITGNRASSDCGSHLCITCAVENKVKTLTRKTFDPSVESTSCIWLSSRRETSDEAAQTPHTWIALSYSLICSFSQVLCTLSCQGSFVMSIIYRKEEKDQLIIQIIS